MIFECTDGLTEHCPLKGSIIMACHKHSDDPILEGAEISCWVDGHGVIIRECRRRGEPNDDR